MGLMKLVTITILITMVVIQRKSDEEETSHKNKAGDYHDVDNDDSDSEKIRRRGNKSEKGGL